MNKPVGGKSVFVARGREFPLKKGRFGNSVRPALSPALFSFPIYAAFLWWYNVFCIGIRIFAGKGAAMKRRILSLAAGLLLVLSACAPAGRLRRLSITETIGGE